MPERHFTTQQNGGLTSCRLHFTSTAGQIDGSKTAQRALFLFRPEKHARLQTAEVCEQQQQPGRQHSSSWSYMSSPGWQEEDFRLAAGVNNPPYAPVGESGRRSCRAPWSGAALEDFLLPATETSVTFNALPVDGAARWFAERKGNLGETARV